MVGELDIRHVLSGTDTGTTECSDRNQDVGQIAGSDCRGSSSAGRSFFTAVHLGLKVSQLQPACWRRIQLWRKQLSDLPQIRIAGNVANISLGDLPGWRFVFLLAGCTAACIGVLVCVLMVPRRKR